MSTCPEKDIHSIYVDSELPAHYENLYKEHLRECNRCSQVFNRMKQLHTMLQNDAETIKLSSQELDDSFSRLQVRMSYHEVTSRASRISFLPVTKWSFAAAALLVAVLLPFQMSRHTVSQGVANDSASAVSFQSVSSAGIAPVSYVGQNESTLFDGVSGSINGRGNPAVRSVSYSGQTSDTDTMRLISVDMFKPDLVGTNSSDSVSIQIQLLPVNSTGVYIPLTVSSHPLQSYGTVQVLID